MEKMAKRRDYGVPKVEDGTLTLRDMELDVVCESREEHDDPSGLEGATVGVAPPRWEAMLTFAASRRISSGETGALRLSDGQPRSVRVAGHSTFEPLTQRTSMRVVGLAGTTMKAGL
jgi:hypothetical protein